jgi:hypothetical protein
MKLFIGLISMLFLFSFKSNAEGPSESTIAETRANEQAGIDFAKKVQEAKTLGVGTSGDQQAEIAKQMLIIKENQEKAEKMLKEMDADQ